MKKQSYSNSMAQYAIAFDLDTKGMKAAGMTQADITQVYQLEIPVALAMCGFTVHPQGSLYHTDVKSADVIAALMKLESTLKKFAPKFCEWIKRVHVFRMEEWSDVTELLATKKISPSPLSVEEEIEQQEILNE